MWPPFASCSATHLLHIELIRLLIVACEMLFHSSLMAVQSCWILAGTGTRCRIRWSRASQTCSMGDMSGEYAGHARTGMFSASMNCVQILSIRGRVLSCCNIRVMVVDKWQKNRPQDLVAVSLCIQNAINKMHRCSMSITYACPYHNGYLGLHARSHTVGSKWSQELWAKIPEPHGGTLWMTCRELGPK